MIATRVPVGAVDDGRLPRGRRACGACVVEPRHIGDSTEVRRRAAFVLTSRAASPKRRSTSRAVCLTQAGGARGRRAWAARAGGAGGRRKRAARAGGARGWREVMVCRLRADGAALLGGRGWPPSVRCGFAMGRRSTPKGVPGIVGAGPKDLPSSVEGSDEVRSHCWCPRARGPFSRQDVSKHEFEEIDRSARRRHADVAAEDQGSDGRGCDDGAREASESGIPSRWRSQLGAAVVPTTRTPRPFLPPGSRPPLPPTPITPTPKDQGSDGRGCGDGAREASESGIPSRWRSQLRAAVIPITRTRRPFLPPLIPDEAGSPPNPNHPNPNHPKTPPL